MIYRKKKYYYNPDTLKFEEIRYDKRYRTKRILSISFVSFIFLIASGYLFNYYLYSPETFILKKKTSFLESKLHDLWDQSKTYETLLESDYFKNDNLYRTILELDTLPYSIRYGGTGGSAEDEIITFNSDINHRLEQQIEKLRVQLQIQRNSFVTVYNKAVEHNERLRCLPAIQPVSKGDVFYISSYFGTRTDPFDHEGEEIHTGIDFVAPFGANVYSTAEGTVTLSQFSRTGYGNEIVINHSFGFSTRYAHLEEILVKTGDKVKRGQLIGKVGSSGRSTGPHLHYEVRLENKPINPISYFEHNLNPDEYEEIIAIANNLDY